jgi:hypothetical protein
LTLDPHRLTLVAADVPKPRLPSHPGNVWKGDLVLGEARTVYSVSVRDGLLIAGGDELFQLRPGAEGLQMRQLPSELGEGPVYAAAVEPRPQRRYAAATYESIVIFMGDKLLRLGGEAPRATHLAWGSVGKSSGLYIRREDDLALQMKPDLSDLGEIPLEGVAALASDDAGAVALVLTTDDLPLAYVTKDGEQYFYRELADEIELTGRHVHLAVAGLAVAVSIDGQGAWVSRGQADPFVRCEALGRGGPLAFEGVSEQAALFGGVNEAATASIVRVEPDGSAFRIAELLARAGEPPRLSALAWDASRKKLWAASPQAGIVSAAAPRSQGGGDEWVMS